jgi:hypothetical protein
MQISERETILRLAASHGAQNVRIFGSFARGEAGSESDLDVLVTMEPGRSLFDLIALGQDLERSLKRPVDVVSDAGLSPHLRSQILAEAVPL